MEQLDQAKNLIGKSQNILVVPAPSLQGDIIGSALALFFTLKKLGKKVNLYLLEKIPEKFCFLANQLPCQENKSAGTVVLTIDGSGKEISTMRYEKKDDVLKIYFTLNKGELKEEDVSLSPPKETSLPQDHDLLITVGAKSLEDFGKLFNQNSQLFYRTPILNIDNQLLNESFGEVNLSETTSSLAEITTDLIKFLDQEETLLDGEIATCLLTALIWSSQNFRNPKTKPRTFEAAAFLIKKGGNHQKIVYHLYKQKSTAQIRLLGKVLGKLKFNEEKELHLAALTGKDFQECQASSQDLGFVMEELKFNFRYLSNFTILWESHSSPVLIKGVFYSPNLDLTNKILENFESVSRGGGALFLIREGNLDLAQEILLKSL